jgi:hypothetical protein
MRCALSLLLLAAAVAGCRTDTSDSSKIPLAQTQAQSQAPAAASGAATRDGLSGPVLEHLTAPPYMYLRVKTSFGEVWAAVPQATIENGTVVTVYNAMLMSKFESKSLKRTFDEVYFGTLTPAGAAPGAAPGSPRPGSPKPPAGVDVGKVEKATGPDAHTVSEVWAEKASLVGKTVTIRGVVVKYNDGVMGRNWMHLQDGSGDAKQGTNDITVTSKDGSALGETVTIRGTLHANRDFGAGYSYVIIVEDAKVLNKQSTTSAR